MLLSSGRRHDGNMKEKQRNKWNEVKKIQFGSIFVKNFFLIFVCMFIPIVFVNIWYNNYLSNKLNEKVKMQNEQGLRDSYDKFEAVVESARDMTASICWDRNVRYLAVQSELLDKKESIEDVTYLLETYSKSNEYMDSVCVYFLKTNCFITETEVIPFENYNDRECIMPYIEGKGFRENLVVREKNQYYPYVLTIVEPIKIDKENILALAIVNINVESLGDFLGTGGYQDKGESPFMLIIDVSSKKLVYSDKYSLYREKNYYEELQKVILDEKSFTIEASLWGESYLVSGLCLQDNILCLQFATMEQWMRDMQNANVVFWCVVLVCTIVCLIVTSILSMWLYRPVDRTLHVLKESRLLRDTGDDYRDELEIICYSIEAVKEERDFLNKNITERVVELQKMQMYALQGQINPHFLYNTLDAIGNASALLLEEENVVTEMIYTLGSLMRVSLSKKSFLVKLSEEIEHIKLYIQLLDFRFKGRIQVHFANLEEQYEEKIIKLTLQPLVENAVQHGIMKKEMPQGNIWIIGEKRGSDNYIHVCDDGEQVDEERLKSVRLMLKDDSLDCTEHIGLKNVKQRIKNLYGEECGLVVSKAKEGGMCVTIHYRTLG